MWHSTRQWLALFVLGLWAVGSVVFAAHAAGAPAPVGHFRQDPRAPAGGPPSAAPTVTPCVFGLDPWRGEPPLPAARSWAGGAVVNDKFYVVGGVNGADFSPAVERFDPAGGGWATLALIPFPISQARVAVVGGKIYVPGGFNPNYGRELDTMQIYDTATNAWSLGAPLPGRRSGAGVAALDGNIYIIAGNEPMPGPSEVPTNTVFMYNPAGNTYTTRAPLPVIAANLAAIALDGRIYALGGTLDYAHYAYDPATNVWTPITAGPTPNFQSPGLFVLNGEIWAVGGQNGAVAYPPEQQVQIYNPASDSWRFGPPLLTPRLGSSAAGVSNYRAYIVGGRHGTTRAFLDSMESIAYRRNFRDVEVTNPFYEFIRCLACRGIVSGYSDETFRWGANVTRGQLSKILAGAAGFAGPIPPTRQSFADVPPGNPFWLSVERLYLHGAIVGYACGGLGEPCDPQSRPYFRWGLDAGRGQIAKITAAAAGWNGPLPTTRQTFEDVPSGNPFWLGIEELAGRGILSGYTCGGSGEPCGPGSRSYFRPYAPATRGQMSKIAAETFYPNCQTPAGQGY